MPGETALYVTSVIFPGFAVRANGLTKKNTVSIKQEKAAKKVHRGLFYLRLNIILI